MKKLLCAFALSLLTHVSMSAQQRTVLDKVNLFMGTADDYGQMTPGATVPYGQIQVCPDSDLKKGGELVFHY